MGFCWQFITLAGFHANALVIDNLLADFAQRGMLAYVQDIQRQERTFGVETLSHQTWSSANHYDQLMKTVTGGISSTAAMGKGENLAWSPILFCCQLSVQTAVEAFTLPCPERGPSLVTRLAAGSDGVSPCMPLAICACRCHGRPVLSVCGRSVGIRRRG